MVKLKLLITLGLWSSLSFAQVVFNHKWNGWATHQPVLYTIAMKTTGPIIEFGSGNNSTDLLHEICKKDKRLLITLDDNLEWFNKFKEKYLGDGYELDNSGWHKFFFVSGDINNSDPSHWVNFLDNFDLIKSTRFDLCFVDQSPGGARTATINRLKNSAQYIILHDCDMYVCGELGTQIQPLDSVNNIPGVYDFSKTFRYFKVFFPLKPWPAPSGPPTLLGSNLSELPDIDYENY